MNQKRQRERLKKWMRKNGLACYHHQEGVYDALDYHLTEIAYRIEHKISYQVYKGIPGYDKFFGRQWEKGIADLRARREFIMKYLCFNTHAAKQMIQYALLQSAAFPNAMDAPHRKAYAYELIAKLGGKK